MVEQISTAKPEGKTENIPGDLENVLQDLPPSETPEEALTDIQLEQKVLTCLSGSWLHCSQVSGAPPGVARPYALYQSISVTEHSTMRTGVQESEPAVPLGVAMMHRLTKKGGSKEFLYRLSVLLLTFLAYTAFHASRKPLSIVKNSPEFLNCSGGHLCSSWISQLDQHTEEEARTMLGLLDTAYLVTYAICMFVSGLVAERVDLRLFLSFGMLASGLFTVLFGLARPLGIHSVWYLVVVQVASGVVQTAGWPGVVTVMANWFGKGKRGLIMGLWNSHTSLGNILGALLAGAFANTDWGMAFILPGLLIAGVGVLTYLFLVPDPSVVGLVAPRSPATYKSLAASPASLSRTASSSRLTDQDSDAESTRLETSNLIKSDSDKAIGFFGALQIPGVVEYSLCLFFAKLVSYTFLFWLPNYISSTTGLDAKSSATLSTFFDVGGIVGGVIAGLISDQSGMSATTCAAMLVAAVPTLLTYQASLAWCPLAQVEGLPILDSCYFLSSSLLVLTGLLVNGPYALITTAVSAELGTHKSLAGGGKALATVTAIIDGTGSIGAAVGPFLAGWLAGGGAWDSVFTMLVLADMMALLLLARLMKREVRRCWRRRFSF